MTCDYCKTPTSDTSISCRSCGASSWSRSVPDREPVFVFTRMLTKYEHETVNNAARIIASGASAFVVLPHGVTLRS